MLYVEIDLASLEKVLDSKILDEKKQEILLNNTLLLEEFCKIECPVDTGRMQSSISSVVTKDMGVVSAHVGYAKYVIDGTNRRVANNYPLRAVNTWKSRGIEL